MRAVIAPMMADMTLYEAIPGLMDALPPHLQKAVAPLGLPSWQETLERMRAILHNCVRTGPAAQNRDGHPDFRAHLLGRISWVASVAPAKRAKLMAMFERIAWA